jgi:hypothetical protein
MTKCVFNKTIDGQQCTIVVYVDDFFVDPRTFIDTKFPPPDAPAAAPPPPPPPPPASKKPAAEGDAADNVDNPLMAAIRRGTTLNKVKVGKGVDDEKGSPPFDIMEALKTRVGARRAGVGDEGVVEEEDWGGGGHIKKKLLRKQTYRNLNSINNKTSRKKTKLTEIFKSKKNNKKTLRKR